MCGFVLLALSLKLGKNEAQQRALHGLASNSKRNIWQEQLTVLRLRSRGVFNFFYSSLHILDATHVIIYGVEDMGGVADGRQVFAHEVKLSSVLQPHPPIIIVCGRLRACCKQVVLYNHALLSSGNTIKSYKNMFNKQKMNEKNQRFKG